MEKYYSLERWTLDKFKGATRFVYAYIAHFSDTCGECKASQEYIASRLCCDVRTVKRAVQRLRESGWIHVQSAGARKKHAVSIMRPDAAKRAEARREWSQRNEQRPHKMPDVLRVWEWMPQRFGTGADCLLLANLIQLAPGEKSQEVGGVFYGQKELGVMCGCTAREIRNAANSLQAMGILDKLESNVKWKLSRRVYLLHVENLHSGKNVTFKTDEEEKMSLLKPDEEEKMSPYEYIDNEYMYSDECSACGAQSPSHGVENSETAETDETKQAEQADETSTDETEQAEQKRQIMTIEDLLQEGEKNGYSADIQAARREQIAKRLDNRQSGLANIANASTDIQAHCASMIDFLKR